MDDNLISRQLAGFVRFSNFYQSPSVFWTRILIFLGLSFLVFNGLNTQTSLQGPLVLFSFFLILEIFIWAEVERFPPQTISFLAAKILASSDNVGEIIKKLLKQNGVRFLLLKCEINPQEVSVIEISKEKLLGQATQITKQENLNFTSSIELFTTYLLETEEKTKLLFKHELKSEDLLNIAHWARAHFKEEPQKIRAKIWGEGLAESWVSGWTLETQKYTFDFTKKVLRSSFSLDSFYGREKELNLLIESLLKSQKQNAILVGEPGVGKTTLVKALALKMFSGDAPSTLSHKKVLELSVAGLLAGSGEPGVLEERLKNIITEIEHAGRVVLFIPEIQNILGATSLKLDISGILLPALLGDKIQVVATATPANSKTFIEKNPSFSAAFDKIQILEPDKNETLRILEEQTGILEKKHKVNITYQAIVQACELAQKYLPDRSLPGKVIDLLDEATATAAVKKKKNLEKQDLTFLIEQKTHVAVGVPREKEKELLLNLEKILHQKIIGQEEAVKTVSEALRRLRGGVSFGDRPVGTFLFLGPTGVGKTQTAKTLAEVYFGDKKSMIRFDMSEFQNQDSAQRLADLLVEKTRQNPFSLLLLDEFEKAHPQILDLFLQVFEDARLSDSLGRTASFLNTIIIATSNAGAELIREKVGQGALLQKIKGEILDSLQKMAVFKPELLNRFDAVVFFEPLGEKEVFLVTKILLSELAQNLTKQEITVKFSDSVVTKIAKEGFEKTLGGRPLRRFIQDNLENLLAQKILRGEIKRGNNVLFSTDTTNRITLLVT